MTRAALLAYIDNNVYPNANNEITALMVRDVLHRMVGFMGDAATYGVGDVAPSDPGLVTGGAVQGAINTALSSAIKFQGVTTTPLTDGSTDPDIVIAGDPYTARRGDEVIYGGREFLWTGSLWQQLGDEQSWALKTITISAGAGLVGGGNLTANRTISLSQDSLNKLALAASAYQVPQGGIPKTDLASDVQTTLGSVATIAGYFSGDKLKYANLPDLYLARTKVKIAAAQDTLLGITAISNAAASDASDKSRIEWDDTNKAWHFYGNIYTDGWFSGGGISQGSGGGGGGIDPAAMWSLLGAPTSEQINSTHISFPVTSVAGYTGAVSAAQIAAALGLGSMAYQNSADYLPKTGGTLGGVLTIAPTNSSGPQDVLVLHDNGGGGYEWPRIRFSSASYTTGHTLSVAPDSGVGYIDDNVIWHSGNFNPSNYLSLNGGTMSNTNLVTYLNAEYLNGRKLTQIPYLFNYEGIGSSATVSVNDLANYYASTGMIYSATDNPTGGAAWCHVWSQAWGAINTGWVSQIAVCPGTGSGMWYRCTSGSSIGLGWKRVWDSDNANKSDVAWKCSDLNATNIYGKGTFQSNTAYYGLSVGSYVVPWYGVKAYMTWDIGADMGIARIATSYSIQGLAIGFGRSAYSYSIPSDTTTITDYVYIKFGGNVGIRNANPAYELDVTGVIHASTGIWTDGYLSGGGLSQSSDRRLKKAVKDFAYTPALLMAIRPREWDWNGKAAMKGHAAGFVAQEIEELMPYAVDNARKYKALFYDQFHALEVAALQDHETRLVAIEKENEAIRKENVALRLENRQLRERLNMN